ncbi:hypothetical protein A5821_002348 [Enterococcus sp. 7F3_DIV0205]|uniref:Uncharacterized protein n=1 Tax=Candidatus Enterococcus palustris TaxID=1834189 RepID=A0AAQ3Y813_9ENTE|nr:hypothetical protein [Enterococcus sp. 7F3_DIV0205]OTN82778.1 hypothetical protein A5821_002701 [Enterococcus sp. 7F3_DIV0205]
MGKKTESEKNVERQNLRNVYEPEIRAMEANITSLTTEIEFLTMKKIFLDSNVTTLDTTHQNFRDLMNTNKNKFNEIDTEDLKGNYMVQVNAQASAVIGDGQSAREAVKRAWDKSIKAQTKLDKKIEKLRSKLSSTMTTLTETQFQFRQALNSII